MSGRVLGLDIGDVRIGIALSDEQGLIASPLEVYTRVGWGPDSRHIAALCRQHGVSAVVSGLPLNMDGSAGFQSQKVRDFCAQLEKAGLTVYYQDERLSTVAAEGALLQGGMRREQRKERVDKVAAAVILQTWLDSNGQQPTGGTAMSENYEQDDLIELVDEEGNTVSFEHLATLQHEDVYYLVLSPTDAEEDEEGSVPVVFMEIGEDENGEETYLPVEDDELCELLLEQLSDLQEEQEDEQED